MARPKIGLVYKSVGLTLEMWKRIKRLEKNANSYIRTAVLQQLDRDEKKPKKKD